MKRPLVTIGILFKDPGPLLVSAIKSVFSQTISDWELILINDGSKDNSIKIIEKIKDPRVIIIDDGKHLGLIARLNQIINISRGEYIARMDADDMMHPRRLEEQLRILEGKPEIDVIDTGAFIINKSREPLGIIGIKDQDYKNKMRALKWGVVLHPSVMAKRRWYENSYYSVGYPRAEDRELFIRKINTTNIFHLPKPLYYYLFADNVKAKEYLIGYKSERKVILKYGPRLVGWSRSVYLYLRSILKSGVLIGLWLIGTENIINKNKYYPLSDEQKLEAKKTIELIDKTRIPGMEL